MLSKAFNSPTGGLIRLLRPADCGLAFAAAVASARLSSALNLRSSALASAAIAIVVAGAFVNKAWVYQREYLLVRPSNPIATGLVRADEAKWLGWGLIAVGVAAAATMGLRAFAAAFLAASLLLGSNYFLEKYAAGRVIAVITVAALPAFYGCFWRAGDLSRLIWLIAFLICAAAAAGLYGDVESREGDEVAKRRSLASSGGRGPVIFAGAAACAAAAAAVFPYFLAGASVTYFAVTGGIASVMLVYAALNARRRSPDPLLAGSTARMVKFLVFIYLAASYLEPGG